MIIEYLPTMIERIVDALITVLPALIEGLIQLIAMLVENLPTIITALIEAMPQILSALNTALFQALPILILGFIKLFWGLVLALPEITQRLIKAMPEVVVSCAKSIAEAIPKMIDAGKKMVEGLWEGIKSMGDWLKSKFADFINGAIDAVKNVLGIHSPSKVFADIGRYSALGLGQGFSSQVGILKKSFQNDINSLLALGQGSTLLGLGRGGGTNSYAYNNTFNFNVPTVSPYEIERAMRQASFVR
jgi:phage-related protein